MPTAAIATRPTDPLSRPAASWTAKLAAFKSRGVPDDDPRVVECRAALSFHRLSKVIDAEQGNLPKRFANKLATRLRAGAAS